ncbi:radical SAM protein [Desulfatiglans anilini]|uniref:radical SAM protein n=1 Tax=Desulfatiglans anilini TaxID=90728 RepID=UPI0012947B47|nr:radical SAM protein [Desulfatiglans anilini]
MGVFEKSATGSHERLQDLPFMLYADASGNIYEHPYLRMVGFSGQGPYPLEAEALTEMPEFSKLFFIPGCPPIGLDPETGRTELVLEEETAMGLEPVCAVAVFLEPGWVRSHLPAADYRSKDYTLPMWAYTAVGSLEDRYWAAGFQIEYNHKWDPRYYDDDDLLPAVKTYRREHGLGPLARHLVQCATKNHCFAAKNLFLGRWEAPLPVSRSCNAACLGCLSFQPEGFTEASHERLSFRPDPAEVVALAVRHLQAAREAIMSFGQGCEGEPLTEYRLMGESIVQIRRLTGKGTINLNTNGSWPERVRHVIGCGLDSIRISLNSARADFYEAYYRPKGYRFADVVESIRLSRAAGLYTMINYLVFPGITDQEAELEALEEMVRATDLNFIHLKNLCIDPQQYLAHMPLSSSPAMGMRVFVGRLRQDLPQVQLGYFNQPVR